MQGFIYFVKYALKKQKGFIIMKLLEMFINSLSPVLLIYIPKFIIDAAVGGDQRRAVACAIIYVIAYLLLNTGASWLQYGAGIYSSKLFKAFEMDMAEKLLDADLGNLESRAFKEQRERAEKYIYADGYGFGYIFVSAVEVIQLCITALSYVFIIFNFSPLLVLINLVFTIISFRVGGNIKKLEKQDRDAQIKHERRSSYYSNITSDHTFHKDIRIFSYKPSLLRKMAYHYDVNTRFYAKLNRRRAFSEMLSNTFYAIQLGIGYAFIIALLVGRRISVGDFTLYVSALTMYASLMGRILERAVYVRSYDMYFHDFKDYINLQNMKGQSDARVDRSGPISIEFKNVSFRYVGSEAYALKNVSIKISDSDRIAIVGENGSGKTTFVKLLMRLYDPTEGRILVNGVDIREYSYEDYIDIFSAVFQDYSLFATTIGENITMNDQLKVDDKFAEELSEIGLLTKAVLSYPKHFDTSVYKIFDDQGIEPSGGEGQQIAIARSLHKKAKINILDEPTAALDPKIEYEIYQKYDAITRKNLSFFVSHRLGSCKFANRILVFSDGRIIEDGSHSELLRKNGVYSELYNYQAALYSAADDE
jgi:ABC-type multidrug transport system fused ATPase/permease subunit